MPSREVLRRPYPVVEVVWEDTVSNTRWADLDAHKKRGPALCQTSGYLIHQDEKTVKIAQTWNQEDTDESPDVADVVTIPRGCVRRIVVIKKVKRNGKR